MQLSVVALVASIAASLLEFGLRDGELYLPCGTLSPSRRRHCRIRRATEKIAHPARSLVTERRTSVCTTLIIYSDFIGVGVVAQ